MIASKVNLPNQDNSGIFAPKITKSSILSAILNTNDNKESYIITTNFKNIYNMEIGTNEISLYDSDNIFDQIISGVDLVLKRFPEIEYIIDLFCSSVVYGSYSSNIKLDILASNKKIKDVVETKNFTPLEEFKLKEFKREYDDRLKDYIYSLFNKNSIVQNLFYITNSLYKYGLAFVYFSPDYEKVDFLSLKDVKVKYKSSKEDNVEEIISKGDEVYNNFEFYNLQNKRLNPDRLYILSNKGALGKSLIKDTIHYFKILDMLETSLILERISKSTTMHVQKVLINPETDDDSENLGLLALYKNLISSKSIISIASTGEYTVDLSKNLLDNHIVIPVFDKDSVQIETIKSEFKPIILDIEYYQDKIYYALGIPLHYRSDIKDAKAVPTAALQIHDNAYSLKVKRYQTILEEMIKYQVGKVLEVNNYTPEYINVDLPEFIPITSKQETDLTKLDKILTSLEVLSNNIGIPLKKEFILNLVFPEYSQEDIVDISVLEEASKSEVNVASFEDNTLSENNNQEENIIQNENTPNTIDELLNNLKESLLFKNTDIKTKYKNLYMSKIKLDIKL